MTILLALKLMSFHMPIENIHLLGERANLNSLQKFYSRMKMVYAIKILKFVLVVMMMGGDICAEGNCWFIPSLIK